MKNFALIGAAGYIAPRHLKAIKDTGNNLVASLDRFDSVGIIDSYFPDSNFFTEFERFDRFIDKYIRSNNKLDYTSVCTPNYLHDSHIRFGIRHGSDVICEKPLVLNPWNIDGLKEMEKDYGCRVWNIFQLRLHPAIIALKKKVEEAPKDKVFEFDLTYITSRGNWYYQSWKGDTTKSGGIATNIGVHFYDMLSWIFGKVKNNVVHVHTHDRAAGFLEFDRAKVRWFLSINADTIPAELRAQGKRTYRSMNIEGEEIEFSDGFTDLHTTSYKEILAGRGFGLDEAYPSIGIVHDIRHATPIGLQGDYHPFAKQALVKHPFGY
ncbi:MAG: Gfo/Idh/MocA family oxidoreductase [Chitinophagales bacterium]|jgi:UDP-N-acetyl-2-amino-2-deoxyglucuronate dehydrogenase|nr:Gfo/Idh/MocA family oxidoreductase [Chitinophagales bacterium]